MLYSGTEMCSHILGVVAVHEDGGDSRVSLG